MGGDEFKAYPRESPGGSAASYGAPLEVERDVPGALSDAGGHNPQSPHTFSDGRFSRQSVT